MLADLGCGRIKAVRTGTGGIHDYLTEFLEKTYELGNQISTDFLVPLNPSHAA